ncbi:hypothetical protein F4823DRAFT_633501 [Ustulina deusta]|nr:hypothetical protein F4823DRAFT_633501 [Ustulina deusta]
MNIKLHSLATSSMDGAAGVLSEGFLGEHGRLAGVPAFPGLQPHHRTAFLERFEPLRETKRSATPETELPWLMWYRSPEHRSAFEESWNTLVASVTDIVWLENNASTFFKPTATEAAAVTKLATFTAFLAWGRAHYNNAAPISSTSESMPIKPSPVAQAMQGQGRSCSQFHKARSYPKASSTTATCPRSRNGGAHGDSCTGITL